MTSPHPVHTGVLSPSAHNCEGCPSLQWEEGARRRRVCMWHDPPRIPGNINCPMKEGKDGIQAAAHQAILHIIRDVMTAPCDMMCSSCCLWVPSEQRCAINLIHEIMGVTNGGRPEL